MKVWFGIVGIFIIIGLGYLVHQTNLTDKPPVPDKEESILTVGTSTKVVELKTPSLDHLPTHLHQAHNTIHDQGHHVTVLSNTLMADQDMWITDMEFILENAPSSVLHHVQLVDLDSLSQTCGYAGEPASLANLGEDTLHTKIINFDEPYGLFIPQGHRLQMVSMFHNPGPPIGTGEDYFDVSAGIKIAYEHARDSERNRPLEYYFLHLDDDPCNKMFVFSVPPNTIGFTKTATGSPEQNPGVVTFDTPGEIRYTGGHLHGWEGGKYVELLVNGEPVRRFETTPSERPDMQWETPQGPDSIAIEAGDTVSVSAVYDNPGSEMIMGPMGMAAFYFAPDQI